MAMSRKGAIAPIVIGVLGVVLLLFLGSWQVQRLAWKEGLIAEIETRLASDPIALPASPSEERDAFLQVMVRGVVEPAEIPILTSIKGVGPGFRIVAPMVLEDGRRILVDLGFVPEALKNIETREGSPRQSGEPVSLDLTGVLFWPDGGDSFTPEPDSTSLNNASTSSSLRVTGRMPLLKQLLWKMSA